MAAAPQDGGYGYTSDFAVPLLFTMPTDQPLEYRTPARSPLRESGSASARRSVTPPGSVHTDTTPPLPPPIVRLHDTLMAGGCCDQGATGKERFACCCGGQAHTPGS